MAYREVPLMEIGELIRRWPSCQRRRRIAASAGLSRNTVAKYLAAAEAEDVAQDGPAPSDEQLSRLAACGQVGPSRGTTSSDELLEPWADQIYQWVVGDRMQLTRIHELLLARGCSQSFQSVRRFVIKRNWHGATRSTVRMEDTPPGEAAEEDFGAWTWFPTRRRDARRWCGPCSSSCVIPATASSGPCTSRRCPR